MKLLLRSVGHCARLDFCFLLLRSILSLLSLRGVVLCLGLASFLISARAWVPARKIPHGRSVCRIWATFQAYSDDSPLRVELIMGLVGSGRWEYFGSHLHRDPSWDRIHRDSCWTGRKPESRAFQQSGRCLARSRSVNFFYSSHPVVDEQPDTCPGCFCDGVHHSSALRTNMVWRYYTRKHGWTTLGCEQTHVF